MGSSGASLRRAALLLFPTLIAAYNIDCTNIFTDGQKFDLSSLAGPHYVMTSTEHLPTISNTTYTIDICRPLERPTSVKDGAEFCPGGTRVCAVEKTIYTDGATLTNKVIPIAGDLKDHKGGDLDAQFTRLRTSESYADSEKEGVRITMNGGIYEKRKQRTIVEFLCDPDLTGEEGTVPTPEDKPGRKSIVAREEGDAEDGEDNNEKEDGDKDGEEEGGDGGMCMSSMKFISYGADPSDESRDLLRLQWKTKFACEAAANVVKTGWGFFTWFLLIAFMGIAAYLIFGSWLNYTRYGARGWDLLPHGDTIRDVPYLFKDWSRRVINTVQGGGSRGGYSAV